MAAPKKDRAGDAPRVKKRPRAVARARSAGDRTGRGEGYFPFRKTGGVYAPFVATSHTSMRAHLRPRRSTRFSIVRLPKGASQVKSMLSRETLLRSPLTISAKASGKVNSI